jgi:hypothetical protein
METIQISPAALVQAPSNHLALLFAFLSPKEYLKKKYTMASSFDGKVVRMGSP